MTLHLHAILPSEDGILANVGGMVLQVLLDRRDLVIIASRDKYQGLQNLLLRNL